LQENKLTKIISKKLKEEKEKNHAKTKTTSKQAAKPATARAPA